MTKRITSIFTALLLAAAMTISAFADSDTSDLDFDKKAVTDAVFLYDWESSGAYRSFRDLTDERVKISEDPFASLLYADVEDFIDQCDINTLYSIFPDSNSDIHDLHQEYNSWYRLRHANHESDDKGLNIVLGYGIVDYENNNFIVDIDNEKYQRIKFIDNGDSFTMVTADETEEIGTYKKVYGFDDTDEDAGGTGGGGSAGGSAGTNGKTGGTSVAGNSKNTDSTVSSSHSAPHAVNGTANTVSEKIEYDKTESYNTSVYAQGNNPAVTPEIVSTVDELKDAIASKSSSAPEVRKNADGSVDSGNTITNVVILIVVIAVIAGVVVIFLKREKKN